MSTVLLATISLVFSVGLPETLTCPVRDLSGDCRVNCADVLILAEQWLMSGGVFQESDGLVVIEAEHYFNKDQGGGSLEGLRWQHLSSANAANANFMQVLPKTGQVADSNLEICSPRLSYVVNFNAGGPQTYYLWLKGKAGDRLSDDVHYGIDGSAIGSSWCDCLKLPTSTAFGWQSLRGDGNRPTLTILSGGRHTVDLWMRDSGVKIDRLLLTSDPGYIPADPPESRDLPEFAGDLDGDYRVAEPDFALLAQHWSQIGSGDPNLIGHWRFDEDSGDVALDSSGNGNDGVIVGASEWSAAGRVDGALNLQGAGSVKIPTEVFSSVDKEITVTLWQYGSEPQPVQDAVFQTSRPGHATNLNIHLPNDKGEVIWDCPSSNRIRYAAADTSEYKGCWNHWTFTKNTETGYARIYLNGSQVSCGVGKTEPIVPPLGVTQASIGSYCSGDGKSYGFYEGMVDDFRIYDRELTDGEVARLAVAGAAWNPRPADNAEHVLPYDGVVLNWSPGGGFDVTSHDVYFGTDCAAVETANNALPAGSSYKGNRSLDANSYDPGDLVPGQTYYWRVDQVTYNKREAPRKGKVWKFKVSPIPEKVYVFNMQPTSFAQRSLMTSIMGIVARTSPEVYLVRDPSDLNHNPKFWLHELQRKFPSIEAVWNNDPAWYLNRYKGHFSGYILYDDRNVNTAASLAGIRSAVIVDSTTESYAKAVGLTMIQDVRGKTDDWVYANYGNEFNKNILFNHNGLNLGHHLRDYAIYKKAFMCWEASEVYWANQNDHTQVFGQWVDEMQFFARCSRHNLLGVAADWLQCGSATSQWKVPIVKQRTHISRHIRTIPGRHYVAFVMSDGDNIQ
ncbi:MAG: hypothetical protein JSU94_05945, partial [Phycisphaerales bacterium]